jgi:hypothetical protein
MEMNLKKSFLALALALSASAASAVVVCDSCAYISGQPATNLGIHDPSTFDNSTFSNSATGANGDFSNWWVFGVSSLGTAVLDAIFLPTANISNFDVKLFDVDAAICGITGAACTSLTAGGLLVDGFTGPNFVSVLASGALEAGLYAINISGTISGLGEIQPASYTGNLQVTAVPEPDIYALIIGGLAAVGYISRRRKIKQA